MKSPSLLAVVAMSAALVFCLGVHADEGDDEDKGDWLCDRLSSLEPPPGCVVIAGEEPKGLCISLASGDPWNCLGSWTPVALPKSGVGALQMGLALPDPEGFALRAPTDQARQTRLVIDTAAVHAAPTGRLPILALASGSQTLQLSAERNSEGSVELVVRRLELKGTPALARLPLLNGISSSLVEWRVHPVLGPQLVLDGHRGQLQMRLPALDAHTRLQTWTVGGAQLHFDLRSNRPD